MTPLKKLFMCSICSTGCHFLFVAFIIIWAVSDSDKHLTFQNILVTLKTGQLPVMSDNAKISNCES